MVTTTRRAKIAKRSVDAACPRAEMYILWDTDLRGFGVRIHPYGTKSYFVQYRLRSGGPAQKQTIGPHGRLTADQARSEAKRILSEVSLGKNPKLTTAAAPKQPTVADSFEQYISCHCRVHLKPRTVEEYSRAYRLHVVPRFGSLPIDSVKRAHVEMLHADLHRSTPVQANRTVAVVRAHFNWLEAHDLIEGKNPCRGIRKTKEKISQRFLSAEEISRLVRILDLAVDSGLASPSATLAIRLLLLTGARKNEILTLRWDDIDLPSRQVHLRDSKTGPATIDLNDEVLKILESAERKVGNPYLCPGARDGHHLVDLKKPWKRICDAAGIRSVRLHDLRHTFASVGVAEGLSFPIIGALLRHKNPQTTAGYAHLASASLRAAAGQIGRAIMAASSE